MISWMKRFIRRHTTPIPYRKANTWRNRLSLAYAVCAWNALGYLMWEYSQGRGSKEAYGIEKTEYDNLSPAQQFAVAAGIEKAKIVRSKKNFEVEDFNLEDFKHLREIEKQEPEDDANDPDNVA